MATAKKDELLDGRESELRLVHSELKKAILESENFQDALSQKDNELKQAQTSLLKQETELRTLRAELTNALLSAKTNEVQLQAKEGELAVAQAVIQNMKQTEQDYRLSTVEKERHHLHEITRARSAAQGEIDVATKHAELLKERVLDLEVALHRGRCAHLLPENSSPTVGSGLLGAGSAYAALLDDRGPSASSGAVPTSLPPLGVLGAKDVSLATRARGQSGHGGPSAWPQSALGSGGLPSPLQVSGFAQVSSPGTGGDGGSPTGGFEVRQ
jgi:hypothetical protein